MTSNTRETLINYNSKSFLRFCVQSVFIEMARNRDGTFITKQHSVITLKNIENGIFIVHPLTEFVFSKWKYNAYNTQRLHANNLMAFLNHIIFEFSSKYKITTLADLEFYHATHFLNYLTTSKKSRATVTSATRTLKLFFEFLIKKHLLIKITLEDLIYHPLPHHPYQKYIESPFKGVILPTYQINQKAHMLPENYIVPFLETVVRVSNPIALGVYMQCFGGIRIGEIVNIRISDLSSSGSFAKFGLVVNLNKQFMRNNIKDLEGSNYVKKPRKQIVYAIRDWLSILYRDHINNYKSSDGSNALFVNQVGNAMTGSSYRYHFNKAKKEFLNQLRKSDNPVDRSNASTLENYKWSTHIGRGIFTNLLAEEATNPYDIALPRGDTNIQSSMVYQANTHRMKEKLEEHMDLLYKEYMPKLK